MQTKGYREESLNTSSKFKDFQVESYQIGTLT